jgi:hypothetical protein
MKNQDTIIPKGHLEIIKIWNSGEEEIVFSEKNTIVSGMGVGLALMFAGSGSQSIKDYQITRFQLGTSTHASYGTSTYELASALSLNNYGASPDIRVSSLSQMINGNVVTSKAFGVIPFNLIRKVDKTSVQFGIFIGPNTANLASTLKEIGLFMNNPFNYSTPTPILVAYKQFSPILKTDQFSLLFKWTIIF